MKPAFALSFSATGISLHHHSDDDWFCIGTVPLNAPDLDDQIQALREQGFALENDLSCKVVIPADQIKYLSVDVDGLAPDEHKQKIEQALADATPYDLSELSYDTASADQIIHVAAVAHRTLEEAQTFAAEHGFIPVLFSAEIGEHDYPAEPQFTLESQDSAEADPWPQVLDEVEAEPAGEKASAATPDAVDDAQSPAVHAIADKADPSAFRSPPAANTRPEKLNTASEPNTKRIAILAIAAGLFIGVSLGAWSLMSSDNGSDTPEVASAEVEPPQPEPSTSETTQPDETVEAQPELTPTDAAILEALKVPPTPVEQVAQDTESEAEILPQTGMVVTPPGALIPPTPDPSTELYLASIDHSDLSRDAVALPPAQSFDTDVPFDQTALPSIAGRRFDLDERGLVTPTPEGTLNPDGIMVFQGPPSSVPPDVPVRFEQEPIAEETDQRLAGLRPRNRPDDLVEQFERGQLGGRSLEELSVLRPKIRPKSLQDRPEVDETPTALAVVRVPRPKARPASIAALAARAPAAGTATLGSTAAVASSEVETETFQPKTVTPKIPTTASVARQATMDNALNLRRLNLIGVYGTPANRRALVRLPSGRYKKLKIGDRIDGGKVVAISDDELRYQKRGRNLTLKMPRG